MKELCWRKSEIFYNEETFSRVKLVKPRMLFKTFLMITKIVIEMKFVFGKSWQWNILDFKTFKGELEKFEVRCVFLS